MSRINRIGIFCSSSNNLDANYYEVARAARENGVQTLELMSSVGASPGSVFFYSRMKGVLEEAQ